MKSFNRLEMEYLPVGNRYSKVDIRTASIDPAHSETYIEADPTLCDYFRTIAEEILVAKQKHAAVICAFGAHAIKNGLGRLIGSFLENGWFTHICTNGAGIIHDWEFAAIGRSSEDVRHNVAEGHFGTWQETGLYINLAIANGAYQGLGYGQSVGAMIMDDGLAIPDFSQLEQDAADTSLPLWKRAAAIDLLDELKTCAIQPGFLNIPHPYKEYSIQPYVARSQRPFTCHPMFGHDIIYTHYANQGASIGRTAERDFLSYADSVSNLEYGIYLSIGSAVMSPMIFEKSLSMSRNVASRHGQEIRHFKIHVVDLQQSSWDWNTGEPPMDDPAYYLRFMKTFNRMGAPVDYTCCDNKIFFQQLFRTLQEMTTNE